MIARPILFSSPMIRAILQDRKFQTRRVARRGTASSRPPFGGAGDRLWVRETFSTEALTVYPCPLAWYRADCAFWHDDPASGEHSRSCDAGRVGHPRANCIACAMNGRRFQWRSSIFMPRALSRITLEVTELRLQRLQEISEDDARQEGVDCHHHDVGADQPTCRASFRLLWEAINGKPRPMLDDDGIRVRDHDDRVVMTAPRAWASNPFVWAISFRRVV